VTGIAQEKQSPAQPPAGGAGASSDLISRRASVKLFRKLLVYHLVLMITVIGLAMSFPGFVAQLPIGGVTDLIKGGDLTVSHVNDAPMETGDENANQSGDEAAEETAEETGDIQIVNTVIRATSGLDRLGYARQLIIVLIGVWALMLPVSWVHRGIHQVSYHDHSLDETTLILPGVVASIVLVVQHSLALAFSLAGIVAGVQFRRALQDTFDALFILVAIGTGIAAGVKALEIAAVLTVFFTYATLYVHYFGDGLESDYIAREMERKQALKQAAARELAEKANPNL